MNITIMKTTLYTKTLALVVALMLIGSALLLSGCPDRVTGTQTANKKPIVYFVNVPPDGYNTSRNPQLYWVGTDADGQVKMFRYTVIMVEDMGGLTPEQYAATTLKTLPDSKWTYLRVNDSLPNPQTKSVVRMSASLTDPVNTFVSQYVFLQAFDEQNLGSDIVFRLYQRNDNPPQTSIRTIDYSYPDNPFINAAGPGGIITGVKLSWGGEDKLDYPVDPPPFEFQWKLFGPYQFDTLTGGEYQQLLDQFVVKVFVGNNGKLYHLGQGERIVFFCDTLDTSAEPDSLVHFACDSLVIDTVTGNNSYGVLDSMLLVDDATFKASNLYRPVDSSVSDNEGWISGTGDTLFNLYRNRPSAVTTEQRFLLWVRCRDDANVPDLVPNLAEFNVIEPRYERDVLLMDFAKLLYRYNAPYKDSVLPYWKTMLNNWKPGIVFDTSDYFILNFVVNSDDIPLSKLLQYKVVILWNDDVRRSDIIGDAGPSRAALKVYKAVDAGVNVWLTMRSPGKSGTQQSGPTDPARPETPDIQYQRYFGIRALVYSGWWSYAIALNNLRIEDFIGTYSLKPGWPDLVVDSAQLHRRIQWGGSQIVGAGLRVKLAWMDSLGYLPEVGWAARHYGTDPLYLYKSAYGASHPLGPISSYEGSPVAIRYQTNLYRTAHFSFTPLGIRDDQMQIVMDSILTWLYQPNQTMAVNALQRYPEAVSRLSASDISRNDSERAALMEKARRFSGHSSDN